MQRDIKSLKTVSADAVRYKVRQAVCQRLKTESCFFKGNVKPAAKREQGVQQESFSTHCEDGSTERKAAPPHASQWKLLTSTENSPLQLGAACLLLVGTAHCPKTLYETVRLFQSLGEPQRQTMTDSLIQSVSTAISLLMLWQILIFHLVSIQKEAAGNFPAWGVHGWKQKKGREKSLAMPGVTRPRGLCPGSLGKMDKQTLSVSRVLQAGAEFWLSITMPRKIWQFI